MGATVVICLLLLAFGVIRLGLADLQPNEVAAVLEEGAEDTVSTRRSARRGTATRRPTTATTAPTHDAVSRPGDDGRRHDDDHDVDHHHHDDDPHRTRRTTSRSATR